MKKNRRNLYIVIFLGVLLGLQVSKGVGKKDEPKKIDYLKVVQEVKQGGQIKDLTVIRGIEVKVDYKATGRKDLSVPYPDERSLRQLVVDAERSRIPVFTQQPPEDGLFKVLVLNLLPMLIFIGLLLLLFGRMSGVGNLMKSRRWRRDQDEVTVTFDDVAGLGEARAEVQEVVEFLENPEKFQRLGARVPRGVLFVGPPGTGKTLMARAAAGESGAAFFSLTGSDFVEMLAGLGANRVRDLFKQAREASPAIIFIDEIDAVGRARSSHNLGGHEEREQTLNQLLSEMDGFDPGEAVVVVAATNRPDILDPALLRPGRFDRQITVDRPDRTSREEILKVHAKGKPVDPEDVVRMAQRTPGFTGAELANLLNEAALLAARRNLDKIDAKCLDDALERLVAGLERPNRVISDQERTIAAYHEVGHALCAHYADYPLPVQKISIISRGRALGFTLSIPEQERVLETRESLLDQLTMLMGGRAAEMVKFGKPSSGASNDMERATSLAFLMVTRYGMSEKIGPRFIAGSEDGYSSASGFQGLRCSAEVAKLVDDEIAEIIREACGRAEALVREHLEELEEVSAKLQEQETLDQEEFMAMLRGPKDAESSASA